MSILIKGVRLPSNCLYCPMQFGGFCYVKPDWVEGGRVASTVDEAYKQGRPSWCPLEEVPETHDKRTETHATDCISRQAAIDACIRVREHRAYDEIEEIKALPSAQPIIRCKDCKYYHDSEGCFFSTAETEEDGFCSWAERRTDEHID